MAPAAPVALRTRFGAEPGRHPDSFFVHVLFLSFGFGLKSEKTRD